MSNTPEKIAQKITVKIWRPVLDKLESKLDAACLRRDAFLEKVLSIEVNHMDEEVAISNSPASIGYVQECLDKLDRKPISLSLSPVLITKIGEVCERKRIVRDAFFNRFFLVLVASKNLIDHLYFPSTDWRRDLWGQVKEDHTFIFDWFEPMPSPTNPFWAIRETLSIYESEIPPEHSFPDPITGNPVKAHMESIDNYPLLPNRLYTSAFENYQGIDLTGMSCYLPSWKVPGTDGFQRPLTIDDL